MVTSYSRRWLVTLLTCGTAAVLGTTASAQNVSAPLNVITLAGAAGQRQVTNGTGSAARFYAPAGIIVDSSGNLIVADTCNNLFRKVTSGGVVTVYSGTPADAEDHPINVGSTDGAAGTAKFHIGEYTTSGAMYDPPTSTIVGSRTLGIDAAGNVYFADTLNNTIRKITAAGTVSTIAGSPGAQGSEDGNGGDARFLSPNGVAADASGNVYVTDSGNNTIRKVSASGVVTTIAAVARSYGSADGTGSAARFQNPTGIAIDNAGNLYVSDTTNNTIRKITPSGVVSTLAGSAGNSGTADGTGSQARFNSPTSLAVDSNGNLFVADTGNHAIRKISPGGTVSTIAGTKGASGSADGTGTSASFLEPQGITVDSSGAIYVSDTSNNTIRRGTAAASNGSLQVTAVPAARIQTVTNTTVTLKVAATGSPAPTYQWFKDDTAISGATNATLSLSSVTFADSGYYYVKVSSDLITFSSAPTQVQVFAQGSTVSGILIVSQPTDRSVAAGQTASFAVEISSSQSVTYQWTKDGATLAGATNSQYSLASAQSSDIGLYSVTIFDGTTTVSTTPASLYVTGTSNNVAPTITSQPSSTSVAEGSTAQFTVSASGTPAPVYQWQKNGVNVANSATISGATTSTLTLSGVTASDAGNYTAIATNIAGTAVSNAATLTISSTPPPPPPPPGGPTAWLVNLSVRTKLVTGQNPLTVGFYVAGGAKNILVRGVGPTLTSWGMSGMLDDPKLELHPNNQATATLVNDSWDSSLLPLMRTLTWDLASGSKDAAFASNLDGLYSVQELATGNGVVLVEVWDANPSANSPRLTNLSARNIVGTGDDVLIAGFAIRGTGKKKVVIRASSSLLKDLNVPGTLDNPVLEVWESRTADQGGDRKIADNDNWDPTQTLVNSVGGFPLKGNDAGLVLDLDASDSGKNYTAVCKGANGTTGDAMIEVYEVQ